MLPDVSTVLITGATGFIGCRLAEVAYTRGLSVVALIRTWSHAARLTPMQVKLVGGDVLDIRSLREAIKGCDLLVHCAVDSRRSGRPQRRSIVEGTRNVLQAGLEAGVGRLILLSSVGVYGRVPPPGIITEERPLMRTGSDYGDSKIRAEELAMLYRRVHGLPVTILRPTIVYGPFSRYWTVDTAAAIRDGRMVLVNGGQGVCNALYVDNLVDAVLVSAEHPDAVGQIFHISDAEPITWKTFIEGHCRALGKRYLPLPEMTVEEIEAMRTRSRRRAVSSLRRSLALLHDPYIRHAIRSIPAVTRIEGAGRAFVRNVLPERVGRTLRGVLAKALTEGREPSGSGEARAVSLLPRSLVRLCASTTVFPIRKASSVLGYAPQVTFEEGMRRTADWMRWARL